MHFFCWLSQLRQPIKPHANTIIKYPLNFRHLLHWFGVSEHTGNKCIQHIHSPFVVCIVIAIDRIELMNKTQRSMILKKKKQNIFVLMVRTSHILFCMCELYSTHILPFRRHRIWIKSALRTKTLCLPSHIRIQTTTGIHTPHTHIQRQQTDHTRTSQLNRP